MASDIIGVCAAEITTDSPECGALEIVDHDDERNFINSGSKNFESPLGSVSSI